MDTFTLRVAARYKGKKKTPEGNTVYLYSDRQVARRNADKAKRLEKLRGSIKSLRSQVKKDLKSSDPDKVLTALAVALVDHTYERIGNEKSAEGESNEKGEKHYGVTTWQKSHVSFGRNKATIKYVGKSGVKHTKEVTDKAVLSALRDAYEGCEDDNLFCHADGKVNASKVNAYLKEFDITAKDLRGFHANSLMQDHLRAARKGKLSEDKKERAKQLKEEFKKALEATAEEVGHEPSTLRSQYLVPGLEEAYLKDGTVKDKMTKTAERVAQRFAAVQRLDLAWVEGLRKDFLTLMKNLPRVKDYKTAQELREAFRIYRTRFDDLFFEQFLKKNLKHNLGIDEGSSSWIDKRIRSIAWSFSSELLSFPIHVANKDVSEEEMFARFEREVPPWKTRITKRAQDFWKEMKKIIEWFESQKKVIDIKMPTVENATVEGFKLVMSGFDPESESDRDSLEAIREGLRLYRRRASTVAPILLKKQVPIVMEFGVHLDKGGNYDNGIITFFAFSVINQGPAWVAHALAHEMGHHIYKTVLSGPTKEFWHQAITGDFEDLNIQELLNKWPGNTWAYEFPKVLGKTDPLLALQVDAISHDSYFSRELQTKEDFQKLLDSGTRTVRVPKHPITGYANKNPEEAFCETIGLLVANGPNAVQEMVRWWLDTVLPGDIKVASQDPSMRLGLSWRETSFR